MGNLFDGFPHNPIIKRFKGIASKESSENLDIEERRRAIDKKF